MSEQISNYQNISSFPLCSPLAVGSVERVKQEMYILNSETKRIVQKNISFTPGLFKIFDEIIVNAADNKQRDSNMDLLAVEVDGPANTISVKNNGKGIPVVMHKEHNCYVPTLIFGHLLTGSNFDDDEKKTTGGRKLCLGFDFAKHSQFHLSSPHLM